MMKKWSMSWAGYVACIEKKTKNVYGIGRRSQKRQLG
jgi:hypothetical protein